MEYSPIWHFDRFLYHLRKNKEENNDKKINQQASFFFKYTIDKI